MACNRFLGCACIFFWITAPLENVNLAGSEMALFFYFNHNKWRENGFQEFVIRFLWSGQIRYDWNRSTWFYPSSRRLYNKLTDKTFDVQSEKIHNILNSFQSLIILISISMWLFLSEKYYSFNKTITLILVITFFVAAFHAFTIIDYDLRYRFPVIIPLIIIFPISVEIFIMKITNQSKANIST